MMVIADLLGVPRADIGQFKIWSDAIVEPFSMMASRERRIECARLVVEMQAYFADMVAERRKKPRDDLISEAIAYRDKDGDAFTMQELMTVITIDLLASGNETTTAAIGSGLKLLIEDRARAQNVLAESALILDISGRDSAAGIAGARHVQALRSQWQSRGGHPRGRRTAEYSLWRSQPR
jgi:cytochrome P450